MKSTKWFVTVVAFFALAFGFLSCATEEDEKFNITISASIENGTVKSNRSSAAADKTVRLTVTPKSGYELDTISVKTENGNSVELSTVTEGKTYTFTMPESDVTITATFKLKSTTPTEATYKVTIAESENGTVTASKTSGIKAGESITLTITPAEDFELKTLVVKDASGNTVTVEENSFKMPASNVTITATFKAKSATVTTTYSIQIEESENGSVTASKTAEIEAGESITLTITPEEDFELDTLSVKDASENEITVEDNSFKMPESDVRITATFKAKSTTPTTATYKVEIIESENGTVTASKTTEIEAGESITLTITPTEDYELDTLSVKDGSENEITVEENSFVMPESDVTITATFKSKSTAPTEATYKVTITESENGTVTASKTTEIEAGETITLTITPNDDYELDTISVKDESENEITVAEDNSFVMPESDVIVTATFKIIDTTPDVETKAKPNAVGDIVLSDGTAVSKENASSMSASQKAKVIAVIFYIGTECSNDSTSKILGVGLQHGTAAWCTTTANAYGKNIANIVCNATLANDTLSSIEGDKDGSDNLAQMGTWLSSNASTNDTESEVNYPAFYFAKKNKDVENSHVSGTDFEEGWYLPSLPEFYQIYQNKNVVNASSKVCDGSQFNVDGYWTSSMPSSGEKPFYTCMVTKITSPFSMTLNQFFMNSNENSESELIVCAIRNFN